MHMRMLHAHKIGEIAFAAGDTFLASESVGAMLLEQGHAVRIDVPEAPAAPTGGEASPPVPVEPEPVEQEQTEAKPEPVEQEKPAEQPAEAPTAPVEPKTHRGKPKPTGGEAV